MGSISREHLDLFVGARADQYEPVWAKLESGQLAWNWFAFFFGPFWFVYRKMYLYAFGLTSLSAISGITFDALKLPVLDIILNIGLLVAVGVWANSLYYNYSRGQIAAIEAKYPDSEREARLSRRGGTNPVAVALIVLVFAVWASFGSG
ncbi:MAG: DUF2628 domain-containing protein [Gemmatimonadaceae bacterium]|nr:DUF2628 domain-containing protein [Gloeobacterales cyanobacterium ES-bin-141]